MIGICAVISFAVPANLSFLTHRVVRTQETDCRDAAIEVELKTIRSGDEESTRRVAERSGYGTQTEVEQVSSNSQPCVCEHSFL